MLARDGNPVEPQIEDKQELVAYLEAGNKSRDDWRIGTEHEKFGFHRADLSPVAYDGPSGISALLGEMSKRFDWKAK
jgi:glutamate--cysteine ligase